MKFDDYVDSLNTVLLWLYAIVYLVEKGQAGHWSLVYVLGVIGVSLIGISKTVRFFKYAP